MNLLGLVSRLKLVLIAGMSLLALCHLAWAQASSSTHSYPPLRIFEVRFESSGADPLVERLTIFAKEKGWEFGFGQFRRDRRFVTVKVSGGDLEILAVDPVDPQIFTITIFAVPTDAPVSPAKLDLLVADLKSAIAKIPGARIIQRDSSR